MSEEKTPAKPRLSFDNNKLELLPDGGFRLVGQKCRECGAVALGRHPACLSCHSRQVAEVSLSQTGPLANYSIVHLKPSSEWTGPVPYALGEVVIPEGIAVTTLIMGLKNFDGIKVGAAMKLALEKVDEDEEGNDIMCYVWIPAGT